MKKNTLIKFFLIGFFLGLIFPIVAVLVDCCLYNDLELSIESIKQQLANNPIHYIVMLAPIVLGLLFIYIGSIFKKLSLSNQKLYKINEDLTASNEALDSFNYHISHDLKTVLNNSSALTKMIKKYNDKGNIEKVDEITEKLNQVTREGSETVQSFLSLGRVNTLSRTDDKEKLDIEVEIHKILALHQLDSKIQIVFTRKDYETLNIQPKFLESLFLNLLTNAIKYNINKPIATIQLIKHESTRIIEFSDNGIGIQQENLDKIFKPFTRINNELNKEGTGIGLYLVKRLINSIHGEITVQSELNSGTQFTISMPDNFSR